MLSLTEGSCIVLQQEADGFHCLGGSHSFKFVEVSTGLIVEVAGRAPSCGNRSSQAPRHDGSMP